MSSISRTPSLTPSRSPSPEPPVQPDHFYGADDTQLLPSPDSNGKTWLDPADDPLAHRGIPVFKPTMEDFKDFEGYMTRVEVWGARSGIVKVIPPKEWIAALPPLREQLAGVKIKTPIEQHMLGHGGLFRQENMEKRKVMSVREWAEICGKEEFRAPGIEEVGVHARTAQVKPKPKRGKRKAETVEADITGPGPDDIEIKEEPIDEHHVTIHGPDGSAQVPIVLSPPSSVGIPASSNASGVDGNAAEASSSNAAGSSELKPKGRRVAQTKEAREANLAERAVRDDAFLDTFKPHDDWLPPNTKATDYTTEFCQKLERQYWRNCSLGKPAWYGADTQGSLFTDETSAWNVAHLPSTLTRLLPSSSQGLPGVNTPYLYFGMWRATFAWHVEDMDLFSINYIHFGAPKFWYAIPQGRAGALESTMRGYFPKDTSQCPQFLRHKSFLASPTLLAQSSCRPNYLVQHAGEFVITFPRGYHAGFNLGFNCAESVNFALDSWLELGRRAKACKCIPDSVRIDVDQLLMDRAEEAANPPKPAKSKRKVKVEAVDPPHRFPRKRKSDVDSGDAPKLKKIKLKPSVSKASTSSAPVLPRKGPLPKLTVTLKLGPRPAEPESFPCCLCISMSKDGLLRVHDPPIGRKDADEAAGHPKFWMAHEECANIVPETWVDDVDSGDPAIKEKVVFGVDGIVKDRWNLKCSACTKSRPKGHGAPIQCTKGKCPKAFHVSCAKDGANSGIVYTVLREVEKEVVLLEAVSNTPAHLPLDAMQVDQVAPGSIIVDAQGTVTQPAEPPLGGHVLKVIKKIEVQVLCTQHNPAVAAAKKANKQSRIKNDLVLLPSMSRIKIRVSAGVFEVSLIRVIEETQSVEVLWDRGVKREFKWGSVIFGNTDGPVLQKPSELVLPPETSQSLPLNNPMPVATYPSVSAATSSHAPPMAALAPPQSMNHVPLSKPNYAPLTQYPYAPRSTGYDYWPYQGRGTQAQYPGAQVVHPYGYNGYYPSPPAVAGPSQYNPYAYGQQHQYHGTQLNWQQPYQGPRAGGTVDHYRPAQSQSSAQAVSGHSEMQFQSATTHHSPASGQPTPVPVTNGAPNSSVSVPADNSRQPDPPFNAASSMQVSAASEQSSQSTSSDSTPTQTPPTSTPVQAMLSSTESLQKDLASLAGLDANQITAILSSNPELRNLVLAAVGQARRTAA